MTALAATSPAQAATVRVNRWSVASDKGPPYETASLSYVAAPEERNVLEVRLEGSAIVFHDSGAPVAAEAGCQRVDEHTSQCPYAQPINVDTADRDDQVTGMLGGLTVAFSGGPGDDVLTADPVFSAGLSGGSGDDFLTGSDGRDRLSGGAGEDRLDAGAGDDQLNGDGSGAPSGDDVIDGGSGTDLLDYSDRTTPVRVDLEDPGTDGGDGEGDALVGIEDLLGGTAADVLLGDAAANRFSGCGDLYAGHCPALAGDRIEGRAGNDFLQGSVGNDVLDGGAGDDYADGQVGDDRVAGGAGDDLLKDGVGSGADHLSGGAGNDLLSEHGGDDELAGGAGDDVFLAGMDGATAHDTLTCGAGRDRVEHLGAGDRLARDCERVIARGVRFDLRRAGSAVRLVVRPGRLRGCTGTAELRSDGSVLDRARFRMRPSAVRIVVGLRGPPSTTDQRVVARIRLRRCARFALSFTLDP